MQQSARSNSRSDVSRFVPIRAEHPLSQLDGSDDSRQDDGQEGTVVIAWTRFGGLPILVLLPLPHPVVASVARPGGAKGSVCPKVRPVLLGRQVFQQVPPIDDVILYWDGIVHNLERHVGVTQ